MFNREEAIIVENLTKIYKLYENPLDRVREAISFSRKKYHKEHYALDNISFKVSKGETVGVLGLNGSGKSTLLKIISGVLKPSKGKVSVNGKVSSILELGAGFNPEYTGIENIYLNGSLLGLTKKQIESNLDKIIKFADIGDFINYPVKLYSSGMYARLAFSVAINVDPDILVVDEALSVGDMYFQEKSFTKMKEFRRKNKTIFFVSHSISSVRNFCDRAIWLEKGKVKMDGQADVVCSEYQNYINSQKSRYLSVQRLNSNFLNKIYIKNVKTDKFLYTLDDDIYINIELEFNEYIKDYGIGVIIYDEQGNIVTLYNTVRDDIYFDKPIKSFCLKIPQNDFVKGTYYGSVIISDELSMFPYDRQDYVLEFQVENKKNKNGIPLAEGKFRSKHLWIY
ncbi:ABC-type polysaccharide/polyol phosphate transport system ATPase subunit [Anoxybacillus tepidamans]|uniref:ABC-type polysaccharide/polyol phosphate transport system ATPase subunit n=1 Tax=Anoxybacteroides tepidamans TaxID=265948 RepID=A2BD19_9BACL|nr:ABC transporter ATP-binding protein [Anoxybacillus tepidamans]ABM68319.1 Wzt [Anoxybacillus tepidamans]MBB5324200.1 ABC-type polysaccharide/polyol phosphate transport system ATPase subunit [Anoxybacillus tepidamans]